MKHLFLCVILLSVVCGCEKNYYIQSEEATENPADTNGGGNGSHSGQGGSQDDSDDDGEMIDLYSVEEVLGMATGTEVYVVGYIVGCSATSLKSAVYEPPFASTNNIVLSDVPYEGAPIAEEHLMQVCLTRPTVDEFRQELNLKDHPELRNQRIIMGGIASPYYKRTALKNVFAYQMIEADDV